MLPTLYTTTATYIRSPSRIDNREQGCPTDSPRNEYSRDPQFSERDAEVLRFLGEEDLLGFTFEGLRRRLGTHSETLSRILHRLEDQMILEKTSEGYHVTHKGKEMIGVKPMATPRPAPLIISDAAQGGHPADAPPVRPGLCGGSFWPQGKMVRAPALARVFRVMSGERQ